MHQDVVDACRKGDRDAQFKIYKLYYKSMFNTSLRILNDIAEAEDIMQESFLDAFQKLDNYSGDGTFGSWLKRIVINNALDALRKRKETLSLEEAGTDPADETEQVDEEELQLQVREIRLALDKLPEDYRIILSLFPLEAYDHEATSQFLGIPYNNSRTRFSRARQRLLEIIYDKRLKNPQYYN